MSNIESLVGQNVIVPHVVTSDGEWYNQKAVCVEDRGGANVGLVFENAKELGCDRRYALRRNVRVIDE